MFFAPLVDAFTAGKIHLKVREHRAVEAEQPAAKVEQTSEEHRQALQAIIQRQQELMEKLQVNGVVITSETRIPGMSGVRLSPQLGSGYRLVYMGLRHPLMVDHPLQRNMILARSPDQDDPGSAAYHQTAAG